MSYQKFAELLNISESTRKRYVKKLEKLRYLKIEPTEKRSRPPIYKWHFYWNDQYGRGKGLG